MTFIRTINLTYSFGSLKLMCCNYIDS
uniref:Uncharacterized protein n=1 Tax=Anguilla anguilla TaxID=7936 RepID=A0A0E9T411_ANGAN